MGSTWPVMCVLFCAENMEEDEEEEEMDQTIIAHSSAPTPVIVSCKSVVWQSHVTESCDRECDSHVTELCDRGCDSHVTVM